MPDLPFLIQLKNALELVYRDGIARILDWQQTSSAIVGRFLDGNELFSFTIDADGIGYKPEPIPRKDAYLVGYLARSQGMESLLALDSLEYWTGYLVKGQKKLDKSDQCKVGRACGEGCVSRDKACRVKTPIVKRAANSLLSRANSQAFQPKSAELERTIRLKEDEIRLLDHEKAIAYDDQGKILLEKTGDSGSVSFSSQEMDRLKGSVMTHNHPAAMYFGDSAEVDGGSFSVEDWQFAARTQLKEIRAVGVEARYSLTPPKEGWSEDWWREKAAPAYRKNLVQVHGELIKEVRAGKITPDRANVEIWHRTSERTAKALGMSYKREPNQVTDRDRAVILKNLPKAKRRVKTERFATIGKSLALALGVGAVLTGVAIGASALESRLSEQKAEERSSKSGGERTVNQ